MPVRHLAMTAAGGLLLAAAPLSSAHAQAKPSTKATTTTATHTRATTILGRKIRRLALIPPEEIFVREALAGAV